MLSDSEQKALMMGGAGVLAVVLGVWKKQVLMDLMLTATSHQASHHIADWNNSDVRTSGRRGNRAAAAARASASGNNDANAAAVIGGGEDNKNHLVSASASERIAVGTNTGDAFRLADRSRYASSLLAIPSVSGAVLLLRGFDIATDDGFKPWVPHRQAVASNKKRGALSSLLWPSLDLPMAQQQELMLQMVGGSDAAASGEHESSGASTTAVAQATNDEQRQSSSRAASSTALSSSSWVDALRLAAENVATRGERSSEDIETAIESLLAAKRRRLAFEAFEKDSDVPLRPETYDQLLRTFVTDRDHVVSILSAMEQHHVLQDILRRGERTSVAQSVFEALSLHDWVRALDAFQQHRRGTSTNVSSTAATTVRGLDSHSSIPVYSGLLAALIRRGMTTEANTLADALQGADSERDVATGLIRCLHSEREQLTAAAGHSNNSNGGNAVSFTKAWLSKQQQLLHADKQQPSDGEPTAVQFFDNLAAKSRLDEHARVACQVFATHQNAFTCSALVRFLLPPLYAPQRCTPVLQAAIAASLFHPSSASSSSSSAVVASNTRSGALSLIQAASSAARLNSKTTTSAAATTTAVHLARLSIARAIARRGSNCWALALHMAQGCLKAKSFDPVPQLAATVARSGRWNAGLRLGTQLFALRRTPPTAPELSMCVHASLHAGKWSSALFWVERAHSRGLKFDPAVYDAAFAAAAAASASAAAAASTNSSPTATSPFSPTVQQASRNAAANFATLANMHQDDRTHVQEQQRQSARRTNDAAIRTVQCMAEMGGQCSSVAIERLIAAENNSHRDDEEGSPKFIDALCDSGIVDWKL